MPRPRKCRRVCSAPACNYFGPRDRVSSERVVMTLDEYECIRLIDVEELTQEGCAAQMGVARTTVQAMYAEARRKLGRCLVRGFGLIIEGGEYELCERPGCPRHPGCGCGCIHREKELP